MLVQAYTFAHLKPREKVPAYISSYTVYNSNINYNTLNINKYFLNQTIHTLQLDQSLFCK